MPGRPPGLAGMPPGMPGMPPPVPGAPASPGLVSARQRKRKRPPAKGGKGGGLNIQLVRNVVVGLAVVMLLLMLTSLIIEKTDPSSSSATAPVIDEPITPAGPVVGRNDRTDEEIVRDAHEDFRRGDHYLEQWRIADENLAFAILQFRQAEAQLGLVDRTRWPDWTAGLGPKLAEAEERLDQKFVSAKLDYVRYYQSADYQRAMAEIELMLRLVPNKDDPRNEYARDRKRRIRALMSGTGKKHRWSDRK